MCVCCVGRPSPHPICSCSSPVSALVCLLWIPSFAWVPVAGQIRLDYSSLVFLSSCLPVLPCPSHETRPRPFPRTHLNSPLPPAAYPVLTRRPIPTKRIYLFATYIHSTGQQLCIRGRKDSHILHTHLRLSTLADLAAPNAVAIAVAVAVAVSSSSISDRTLDLAPSENPGPTTFPSASSRQFVLDAGPRRSLPCFLACWDTAQVPLDLYTVDPDHCTPPIRPKKQEGRARKPHQGAALCLKVSTGGRRDFLVASLA